MKIRLNHLKLAEIMVVVSTTLQTLDDAIGFIHSEIDQSKEKKELDEEAILYLEMELVIYYVKRSCEDQGSTSSSSSSNKAMKDNFNVKKAETLLKDNEKLMEKLDGVDAIVHSQYFRAAATFYMHIGPPDAYYKSALMYLVYTPIEAIPQQERYEFATNISLAALTGEKVFNFGEVLQTPILTVLNGTQNEWLSKLMQAFEKGNVDDFNFTIDSNEELFHSQPALISRKEFMKEKVVLLSFMNLIFEKPPHERTITFEEIAERGKMPLDLVENLVMRAMSLDLVKGKIDQVDGTVTVTWVLPRVLNISQIDHLTTRLAEWNEKVCKSRSFMDDNTIELVGN